MAGLQEAAAIFGIVDATFRSVSSLYEFLQDLKEVPQQIERLRKEVTTLKNVLAVLEYLQRADPGTQEIAARFDTPAALSNCAHVCDILHSDFRRWSRSGQQSFRTKIQIRWHKKGIEAQVSHIAVAKQTALLSIAALQLAIQLPGTMGERRQTEPMEIDGDVEEVVRNDTGSNRLWALEDPADSTHLRMARVITGGSLTTPTPARQAASDANPGEQASEPSAKINHGRKINQEGWKIKAGEEGRELFGVHGEGLPDDDIKQPRWDISSAKGSCAKYGVTNTGASTETEARK